MLGKLLLCLVIIVIPLVIWNLIVVVIAETFQSEINKYRDILKKAERPETFQAKIINKELINCWTVLTATPSPDGSGFYIKTADRNVEIGTDIYMAVLPEIPNREEELRGTQVILDESGRFLTEADYGRMMAKFNGKLEDAEVGRMMFARLSFYVNAAIVAVTIIISAIILLHKASAGS